MSITLQIDHCKQKRCKSNEPEQLEVVVPSLILGFVAAVQLSNNLKSTFSFVMGINIGDRCCIMACLHGTIHS